MENLNIIDKLNQEFEISPEKNMFDDKLMGGNTFSDYN